LVQYWTSKYFRYRDNLNAGDGVEIWRAVGQRPEISNWAEDDSMFHINEDCITPILAILDWQLVSKG
jgi:hypothetical protein